MYLVEFMGGCECMIKYNKIFGIIVYKVIIYYGDSDDDILVVKEVGICGICLMCVVNLIY